VPAWIGGHEVNDEHAPLRRRALDLAASAASLVAAPVGRLVAGRRESLPRAVGVWRRMGAEPLRHHYYEPLVFAGDLPEDHWRQDRYLAGWSLEEESQLELLRRFTEYGDEVVALEGFERGGSRFSYANGFFGPGDADALYCMVRLLRPRRFVEVGAGVSTLVAAAALERNAAEGDGCDHVCIEPYEAPWLEALGGVRVQRTRVEDVPGQVFEELTAGDILFIDSSHTVRPGGDVLYELLEILPRLAAGVSIHFHDVFLPGEYPRAWVVELGRRWHEQYMLVAFLAFNSEFGVQLALNWLSRTHPEELRLGCPSLGVFEDRAPGSFWVRRL
jgi:hypothetical protein